MYILLTVLIILILVFWMHVSTLNIDFNPDIRNNNLPLVLCRYWGHVCYKLFVNRIGLL